MKKKTKRPALKKKKVKPKIKGLIVVSLKMTSADLKALKAQAKRHAKGNLSAWFRYSGLKYIPKKGEAVPQTPFTKR